MVKVHPEMTWPTKDGPLMFISSRYNDCLRCISMQINCLSLCPEGKLILSGSHDGSVKVNFFLKILFNIY